MYLENDLIESISINYMQITQPGYLSKFIRRLKEKNDSAIKKATIEPEFFIENITHKINFTITDFR